MTPVKNGAYLLHYLLVERGIRHVFSVPGAQTLSFWDRIASQKEIQLLVPPGEERGVWLAAGYGLAGGPPAIVMNTVGPGTANELAALWGASLYKAPLLCITPGQPEYKRKRIHKVFQGLDQNLLPGSILDQNKRINLLNNLPLILDQLLDQMQAPATRGPARLEIQFSQLFQKQPPEAILQSEFSPTGKSGFETPDRQLTLILGESTFNNNIIKVLPTNQTQAIKRLSAQKIPDPRHTILMGLGALLAGLKCSIVQIERLTVLVDCLEVLLWARSHGIQIATVSSVNHVDRELLKECSRRWDFAYRLIAHGEWQQSLQSYTQFKGLVLIMDA